MRSGIIIFLLAFIIRCINLIVLDLDNELFLIEDQKFYWEWSLKGAYLPWGELPNNVLSERMPGAFLFFEFLQWITNKSLFFVLIFQAIVDSITCVIIFSCAGIINKKYQLYTGLFAVFSPLMIIISSQILSDTLFIFIFSCSLYFLLKFFNSISNNYLLYLSGLFLGISAFVRAATFPLIFLSIPVIYFIIKYKNYPNKNILISMFVFIIISLIPVSYRLGSNIIQNDTYALTAQAGSHMAYWMTPGVLSVSRGLDRKSAINFINMEIEKSGGLTGDTYKDSKKMIGVSMEILSKESLFNISYAWIRSSALNIIISPILIDNRVRNMSHPPFAKEGNIVKWMKNLILNKENFLYLTILLFSFIFSLFSGIAFIIGYYIFIKTNFILSIISFFIIAYFCLITGPTISPKYCLPYIPIIFYLQAMSIDKLFLFMKKRKYSKADH